MGPLHSKREIPHYYLSLGLDVARATSWLATENAARPATERILFAALLFKRRRWPCVRYLR
jgi:pyruvate dehydrogenase E2 component (dihydrolipoamide acetyltransferase)